VTNDKASTTQILFCLQKKKETGTAASKADATTARLPFVYRKNVMQRSLPEQRSHPASPRWHAKPARLWKRSCISTGPDVQNSRFFCSPAFCPTSVQHRYNACPAAPRVRKPLTL